MDVGKGRKQERKLCTGCTVFAKEPGMAVALCPRMDGMPQGAKDGDMACQTKMP